MMTSQNLQTLTLASLPVLQCCVARWNTRLRSGQYLDWCPNLTKYVIFSQDISNNFIIITRVSTETMLNRGDACEIYCVCFVTSSISYVK